MLAYDLDSDLLIIFNCILKLGNKTLLVMALDDKERFLDRRE